MDERSLKTSFLLRNFPLLVERLCYTFPFELTQLREHIDLWRWDLISFNENLEWSLELMLEFQEYLDFGQGDEESETKWINLNRGIPWSCEILEAFEDKLQWRELSVNSKVSGDSDIRVRFYHKLLPYLSKEFVEDYSDEDIEESDEELSEVEWMLDHIEGFNDYPELCWHTVDEIESSDSVNWIKLSQNEYLPWSIEIIEKYQDHWDWACLSVNEALPWSMGLIERFVDFWHWGGLGIANEFGDRPIQWGLTSNEFVFWTSDMLLKYKDRHDWFHLSYAVNAEWDIQSLDILEGHLFMDQILFNESIWEGVFKEFVNKKEIERLIFLQKINKNICYN